ncbi:MAG: hypothetical protein ABH883_06815 [Candidatus Omnitrophota bacterium]
MAYSIQHTEYARYSRYIVRSGRELIYEIGLVSDDPNDARSMGELDDIRLEVEKSQSLKALYDNQIWLDISFLHDKKWG